MSCRYYLIESGQFLFFCGTETVSHFGGYMEGAVYAALKTAEKINTSLGIILEAQRLLLHSNLNVNPIGYRLDFDAPSYFVKYFKKHTTISPMDFRKSIA